MRSLIMSLLAAMVFVAFHASAAAHEGHSHGPKPEETTAQSESGNTADVAGGAAAMVSEGMEAELETENVPQPSFAALIANLHPATTHFPIGLLVVAALVQVIASARRSEKLTDAAAVMAITGGIGAVVAAAFGWIHTGLWFGGDATMQWHRWLGTALALVGVLIAFAATRRERYPVIYKALLYSCAVALLVQGYFGGEISRGEGYLWITSH